MNRRDVLKVAAGAALMQMVPVGAMAAAKSAAPAAPALMQLPVVTEFLSLPSWHGGIDYVWFMVDGATYVCEFGPWTTPTECGEYRSGQSQICCDRGSPADGKSRWLKCFRLIPRHEKYDDRIISSTDREPVPFDKAVPLYQVADKLLKQARAAATQQVRMVKMSPSSSGEGLEVVGVF